MKNQEEVYVLECNIFSWYLIGIGPDEYIVKKYQEAHDCGHPPGTRQGNLFDRFLLTFARTGTWTTKIADVYCSLFCKGASLRKKLVLLLAILECASRSYSIIDKPDRGSKLKLFGRCIGSGCFFGVALLASLTILLPIHIVFLLEEKLSR